MNAFTKSLPIVCAALVAMSAFARPDKNGARIGVWTQDYDAAVALAKTNNLPLMLNFTGSDWCGWCMLMEDKVFSKPAWKDWAATNLYLVTLDFPRDKSKVPEGFQKRNRELSKAYGVRGYPTYIVLDSKGEKLGQLGASRDAKPDKFIRQLCGVLGVEPPAKTNAVPADPAAKRLVEAVAAALKATEKEAMGLENPTVAQFTGLNERFATALAAIDTKDVPENLLAAFKLFSDAYAAMTAEFKKLDQSKPLRELGRPPQSLQKALLAVNQAGSQIAAAAEACGVEDAADLLDF